MLSRSLLRTAAAGGGAFNRSIHSTAHIVNKSLFNRSLLLAGGVVTIAGITCVIKSNSTAAVHTAAAAAANTNSKNQSASIPNPDTDTNTDLNDDINLDSEELPPPLPNQPYISADKYLHPNRSNVYIAVADALSDIIDNRFNNQQHVLLEIYSPDCGACLMITPIIDSVATALAAVNNNNTNINSNSNNPQKYIVAIMDRSKNYRPGLLTDYEDRVSPLLKFYPACNSNKSTDSNTNNYSNQQQCEPITYDGPPNAASIIKFIHSNLPVSQQFDLDAALSTVNNNESSTFNSVRQAYQQRFANEAKYSPSIHVYDYAPCAAEMARVMETQLLYAYQSLITPEAESLAQAEQDAALKAYHECVGQSAEQFAEYWGQVKRVADAQVETAEKNKQQQQKQKQKESTATSVSVSASESASNNSNNNNKSPTKSTAK